MRGEWIDELEADLGQAARLRLLANCGGQRRVIPQLHHAGNSALAGEVGAEIARWLAAHFAGEDLYFPSARASETERRRALLIADILESGLTNPSRSNNDLAKAHGVSYRWVQMVRRDLMADETLPLFPDEPVRPPKG